MRGPVGFAGNLITFPARLNKVREYVTGWMRALVRHWRRRSAYLLCLDRLYQEEAETGYKITAAKVRAFEQRARELAEREFPRQ